MPASQAGSADDGVVIHEGSFTYTSFGLECVADLGTLWEERFAIRLPLGCVGANRRVPTETRQRFADVAKASVEHATLIAKRPFHDEALCHGASR